MSSDKLAKALIEFVVEQRRKHRRRVQTQHQAVLHIGNQGNPPWVEP
jgi:hypothetical protein